MNEAQKRLYKNLLKKLDQEGQDDELSRLAGDEETPAEAFERRMVLERRSEEMMRAKAERRLEKKREKDGMAAKIRKENVERKERDERRKGIEEEAERRRVVEARTHQFFRLKKVRNGLASCCSPSPFPSPFSFPLPLSPGRHRVQESPDGRTLLRRLHPGQGRLDSSRRGRVQSGGRGA